MGEVFAGRYELIDPIASGGMGTVWRVHDRQDDQVKAAKILRQSDASSLLRFVREQSMRIDHSHVVTPNSWAGMDDRVLFTMPLVRGGSVSTLLKKYGALPPRWVAMLLDQTLQALVAVHGAGIVHRDIKPGNLLLEPTGTGRPHLRLTDFGIAVPEDEPRLTQVAMAIGTPGYMAPEQVRGADPAPEADIYALGVVTREMLTGQRPTADGDCPALDTLRKGHPHHDAVVDLVAAMCADDPAARPSAAELRTHAALQKLLALPPAPTEAIRVDNEFDTVRDVPTDISSVGHPAPPPSPAGRTTPTGTAYPPPPPGTRVLTPPGTPLAPSGPGIAAKVPGFVLVGLGVLGLLIAAILLIR